MPRQGRWACVVVAPQAGGRRAICGGLAVSARSSFFFFNDTATTEIYTLSLHDALPIYPFTGANNVNGVDDGYRGGSVESAVASVTMTAPNAITEFQDAYVKKTIDTLNDLPNVLWIVSEEAPPKSTWWYDHLISFVRAYEARMKFQHPIGYAALDSAADSTIYNSDADWVAPAA